MDDQRLGTVIRLVRQRRGWRQVDLAARSGVSQAAVSRLERGHIGPQSIGSIRAIAAALDVRVDLVPRWRAGDLDRLLNARHSALHESVARRFRDAFPAWTLAPEVSFAIYSDRGIIDILAWHPGRRALLVIELKTYLADINEVLGTLDRKRRVAPKIAAARGLAPLTFSCWLIVAGSRTNRRRVETHQAMLRAALPQDAPALRRWLPDPVGSVGGLSFWTGAPRAAAGSSRVPISRVRPSTGRRAERVTAEVDAGLSRATPG